MSSFYDRFLNDHATTTGNFLVFIAISSYHSGFNTPTLNQILEFMQLKKLFTVFVVMLALTSSTLAQDAPVVTDEELKKYAVAMDSINDMTEQLKVTLAEKVKSNDKITGTRYNQLSGIINDDTKLAEAKATPEEIAFVKEVHALKMEETAKIQQTFQSLAKVYIGATAYNKIKNALKTDAALKAKYDSLLVEMK
jgi:hypothetical protein